MRSELTKMNCDWTEKISLLVDGELDAAESRHVEGHLADCRACEDARADFLQLRQQLNSFAVAPDAAAQRRALKHILDARTASPRGWREHVAGVFALPRFSPALAAGFALLLVAVVFGVVMLRSRLHVEVASAPTRVASPQVAANVNANENSRGDAPPAPAASTNGLASNAKTKPIASPESKVNKRVNDGAGVINVSDVKLKRAGVLPKDEARQPKIVDRLKLPVVPKLAISPAELVETEIASLKSKVEPTDLNTSQHVEQAQRLLRSFRNARVEGTPSTSDIAYEKRRARALLYRNIILRREAASKGDESVASVLDSLEPILIDIANLPDRPAQTDVRAITERMRRKNIVAMLQVADSSRMY